MDMTRMQAMLEQARQMSEVAGEQLSKVSVEGSAGGGAVRVRMSGRKEVLGVTLDPAVLGAFGGSGQDLEMLEDLLRAAFNDAGRRADEAASGSMAGMMDNLGLPDGLL